MSKDHLASLSSRPMSSVPHRHYLASPSSRKGKRVPEQWSFSFLRQCPTSFRHHSDILPALTLEIGNIVDLSFRSLKLPLICSYGQHSDSQSP